MIKSLAFTVLMSTPVASIQDAVVITKGTYKDCTGVVVDVVQAVEDNLYDIDLDRCVSRFIKRPYQLRAVSESYVKKVSK
jgi:hypothetical protein